MKPRSRRDAALVRLSDVLDAFPDNWCDSILTGPNAALPVGEAGRWGCPDIERLVRAIKARVRAIKPVKRAVQRARAARGR